MFAKSLNFTTKAHKFIFFFAGVEDRETASKNQQKEKDEAQKLKRMDEKKKMEDGD